MGGASSSASPADSLEFLCKYLGSCVAVGASDEICVECIERVKQLKQPTKDVHLVTTQTVFSVTSKKTNESVTTVARENVIYIFAHPSEKPVLSYISIDLTSDAKFCHVFALRQPARQALEKIVLQRNIPRGVKDPTRSGDAPKSPKQKDIPEELPMQIFSAEYMGNTPVNAPHPHTQADAQRALLTLKQQGRRAHRKIYFTISSESVQVVDQQSETLLHTAKLAEISFCAVDNTNKKIVALIANTPDLSFACHGIIFKKQALLVNQIIGAAFAIAAEKAKREVQAKSFVRSLTSKASTSTTTATAPTSPTGIAPSSPTPSSLPTSPIATAPANGLATVAEVQLSDEQKKQGGGTMNVFEAQYYGGAPVPSSKGQTVVTEACKLVLSQNTEPALVILVISIEGLKVTDVLSSEIINTTPLKNLSFVTALIPDKELNKDIKKLGGKTKFDDAFFVCISQDERVGRTTCDFYKCLRAREVCETLNGAFQVALEEEKKKKGNPFAPSEGARDAVKGVLFKVQIHRRDLLPVRAIGVGQFGEVYLANQRVAKGQGDNGSDISIRAVKLLRGAATNEDRAEFAREAELMLQFDHQNLVRLIGVAMQQRPWLVILEYMRYGDLRAVVRTCKDRKMTLTFLEQLKFSVQIAAGMAYLAANKFVHMDLAARNCLVRAHNVVKIADFGLTRRVPEGKKYYKLQQTLKLPIKWMAIEAMDDRHFSESSDVWSFGIVLWEIFSYGHLPYDKIKNLDVQVEVRKGLRLEKPKDCPNDLYALMARCWMTNILDRPSFQEIRSEIIKLAKVHISDHPMRDIGATLAKSGAETIFVPSNIEDRDFDDSISAEAMRSSEIVAVYNESTASLPGSKQVSSINLSPTPVTSQAPIATAATTASGPRRDTLRKTPSAITTDSPIQKAASNDSDNSQQLKMGTLRKSSSLANDDIVASAAIEPRSIQFDFPVGNSKLEEEDDA